MYSLGEVTLTGEHNCLLNNHAHAALAPRLLLPLHGRREHELHHPADVDVRACLSAALRAPPSWGIVSFLTVSTPNAHLGLDTHSFRYGVQLETVAFVNRAPDFAWALLFSCAVLLASTVVLPNYFLSSALIAVLLYLWSRENQAARVSFFGLFTVDGFYLPWVMVGWTLVSGGSPIEELRGIMAAHIYWFLATGWPRAGGPQGLMATPELVRQFIGWAFGCVTHSQLSIHFVQSILHP